MNTAVYVYSATGEHNAVEEQKEAATSYAMEHNLSIVSVYQEIGTREQRTKMVEDAIRGVFDNDDPAHCHFHS